MTWGSDEPHCGDPKPVYLTREQRKYIHALICAEIDADESRHLPDASPNLRAWCMDLLKD